MAFSGESKPERVLLLASKRGYQTDDFAAAAERLGIELVLGTDRCHVLAEIWPEGALALDFRDPDAAARAVAEHAQGAPLDGILATDELTAVIAERARARLGLGQPAPEPAGPSETAPNPAECAGDKLLFRRALAAAGLSFQPRFAAVAKGASIAEARRAMDQAGIHFPVVVKPLHLSASRGVMRADDDRALDRAVYRISRLLDDPEVAAKNPEAAGQLLIESFVSGGEVAFEGLLDHGALHTLAIFDKPDPLDGPLFAETIYVTPSQAPDAVKDAVVRAVAASARAIGLIHGPVHAELRIPGWPGDSSGAVSGASSGAVSGDGPGAPVVIELAARAIGGLCHRALRFAGGLGLEDLLLCHTAGRDIAQLTHGVGAAHGVYMLPVPEAGVLRDIEGVDEARAIPCITDIAMTARPGDTLVPLPEGSAYMGFIFADGETPQHVTHALRRAAARIRPRIQPRIARAQ